MEQRPTSSAARRSRAASAQDLLIRRQAIAARGTGLPTADTHLSRPTGSSRSRAWWTSTRTCENPAARRRNRRHGYAGGRHGGYTAVYAMANTSPVADTAGVVEQVSPQRSTATCDVRPMGAVTVGLEGKQLAELGAMPDSAPRSRVFSDDGKCVHDPVMMRRALEYVKAFGGVVAQHAQEPRLTAGAQMNEGDVSADLGLGGWPAVAEESIIARDVLLAQHVGSRVHICHVSTAGSVEIVRWAKSRGIDVTAEVTPHHLLLTDELVRGYNPSTRSTRRCAPSGRAGPARRARRRHDRHRRHRPRPAPARGQGMRVGRGRDGHGRARDRAVGRPADHGRDRARSTGPGSPTACPSSRPPASAGWRATGRPLGR